MNTYTFNIYLGACSVEILIFQVAQVASINGISPVTTKLFNVEMMCTHTDFLIRIEAHSNVTMLDFVMIAQVTHGLYYLGNACFVVCPKQCCAIGND